MWLILLGFIGVAIVWGLPMAVGIVALALIAFGVLRTVARVLL